MARPKKEPNEHFVEEFEKLCGLQCTKEEICDWFMIADKTLDRWVKQIYKQSFYEVFRQKRNRGASTLRRYQFQLARKNATMAIWLGKQYLNQRETPETDGATLARLDDILAEIRNDAQRSTDDNAVHD